MTLSNLHTNSKNHRLSGITSYHPSSPFTTPTQWARITAYQKKSITPYHSSPHLHHHKTSYHHPSPKSHNVRLGALALPRPFFYLTSLWITLLSPTPLISYPFPLSPLAYPRTLFNLGILFPKELRRANWGFQWSFDSFLSRHHKIERFCILSLSICSVLPFWTLSINLSIVNATSLSSKQTINK